MIYKEITITFIFSGVETLVIKRVTYIFLQKNWHYRSQVTCGLTQPTLILMQTDLTGPDWPNPHSILCFNLMGNKSETGVWHLASCNITWTNTEQECNFFLVSLKNFIKFCLDPPLNQAFIGIKMCTQN
jgi:hypothetical protein